MKKATYSLLAGLAIAAGIFTTACKKKSDDATPASNYSIITTGSWKISKLTIAGVEASETQFPSCLKTYEWKFKTDSTYIASVPQDSAGCGGDSSTLESGQFKLRNNQTTGIRVVQYKNIINALAPAGGTDTLTLSNVSASGFTLSKNIQVSATAKAPAAYTFIKK